MKNRLLVSGIFAFFCPTLLFGNNFVVINTLDSGPGSLRDAVSLAADLDTISFDPALLSAGNDTIKLFSSITITKPLFIKGLNAADTLFISGQDAVRIFDINLTSSANQEINLENLFFIDGYYSSHGGAIRFEGEKIVMLNCYFSSNYSGQRGGAIYIFEADLDVENSTFEGNISGNNGSAIHAHKGLVFELTNCHFQSNVSGHSGTLSCQSGSGELGSRSLYITDCLFSGNQALVGGALAVPSDGNYINIFIENSDLTGNSANTGGGIFIEEDAFLTMTNCTLDNNNATSGSGGAIYSNASMDLTAVNTEFTNNVAAIEGGAMQVVFPIIMGGYWASVKIHSCEMANNIAQTGSGGAISFKPPGPSPSVFEISNSHLHSNNADDYGGAIAVNFAAVVEITGTTIENNTSTTGAGIYCNHLILMKSKILGNAAGYKGGGISSIVPPKKECSFEIVECEIANNSAVLGGGIHINTTGDNLDDPTSFTTITRSSLHHNSASDDGGAIYSYSNIADIFAFTNATSEIHLNYSTICFNTANDLGAGIFSQAESNTGFMGVSEMLVLNSSIVYNTSGGIGDGIYSNSNISALELLSSILALNGDSCIVNNQVPALTSLGYNAFSNTGLTGTVVSDYQGIDSLTLNLGVLQNNGGVCPTLMPGPGPAINNGHPSDLTPAQNWVIDDGARDIGAAENTCFAFDSLNIVVCASYTSPGGKIITATGIYADTVFSGVSCDTILELDVIIQPAYLFPDTIHLCPGEDYTFPDGFTVLSIDSSFNYTMSYLTTLGCDSLYVTTIISEPIYFTPDTLFVCEGSDVMLPDGYLVTGVDSNFVYLSNLVSIYGCDSVVETTVELLTNYSTVHLDTTCFGEDYNFPDGTTATNITSTLNYNCLLQSINGCDSLVAFTINVLPVNNVVINEMICWGSDYVFPDGTASTNITTPQVHVSLLQNIFGCDSVINTNLSINLVNVTIGYSNDLLVGITDAVDDYQWLDCDNNFAPVPGETGYAYFPLSPGNYAVMVTADGCADTSACYALYDLSLSPGKSELASITPNPTSGEFRIEFHSEFSGVVSIHNSLGELLLTVSVPGKTSELTMDLTGSEIADGLYFIRFWDDQTGSSVHKLIIE